jgi:hypothetical protein
MGMFDYIICKAALPIPEELANLGIDRAKDRFQTKSLDSTMTTYRITEDGMLLEEVVEEEYVLYTEEELELERPKPWSVVKDVIIKNRYDKPLDYHGVIVFYTNVEYTEEEDMWLEFSAYLIYGKLDKIELSRKNTMRVNKFELKPKNEPTEH